LAAGVGITLESGTLTYEGKKYPVTVNGLSVGDVGITNGLVATCNADANDADGDGCGIVAGTLNVSSAVIGNIAAGVTVEVQFQVTIN